jgi:predicted GNAT family acetyltransferase
MEDAQPLVVDNRAESRFEIALDGQKAVLVYERTPTRMVLVHTEVPPAFRGRHYGEALAKAGIDAARNEALELVPACPFVKTYLKRHPNAVG